LLNSYKNTNSLSAAEELGNSLIAVRNYIWNFDIHKSVLRVNIMCFEPITLTVDVRSAWSSFAQILEESEK
jgi:hypothetical protein